MRRAKRSPAEKEYMGIAGKQEPGGHAATNTGLTSTALRTTVPAANTPQSRHLAGRQPPRAAVPNPPCGRPAGTTPAHHAAQTGATPAPVPPTQTSGKPAPTA